MISLVTIQAVLKKAVNWNSNPTEESFPELPEFLVWFRLVIAVLYGLFVNRDKPAALAPMLLSALNLIAFIPTMYCKLLLGVKGEAFALPLIFSGLIPAMAMFSLIWIYFYTSYYEMEEAKIAAMLVVQTVMNTNNNTDTNSTDATTLEFGQQDPGMAATTTTSSSSSMNSDTMNAGEEPEF